MNSGRWFKLTCVIAYAVVVGGAMLAIHWQIGAHSRVVWTIPKNQKISAADLIPIDSDRIVGRYTLREIPAGEEIAPKDVAEWPELPATKPISAVIIPMPRPAATITGQAADIQICLNGKALGDPAKPIASICDAKTCVMTLPLQDLKALADAGANQRLSAVPTGVSCPP